MIEIGVDPVAFTIGSISMRWYGIFITLSVVWIVVWMAWRAKKGARLSYDTVFAGALVGIPSGVVIARLLHVVDNIVVAKLHPELIGAPGGVTDYLQDPGGILGAAGLTAYGAVLGAALGVWVYSKFSKRDTGLLFHLLAPAVIMAQAIGRIGCTINGCCYGIATSLPWGIVYTHPNSAAPEWMVTQRVATHPATVYELIYDVIVFGVLWKLMGRVRPDGSLFLIYLGLYSLYRVGMDFLREGNPFLFGLHQAQVIGIIVLVIVIPVLVRRRPWMRAEEPLQQELEVS